MIKKSISLTCLFLLGFVASAKADTLHGFCSPSCGSNGISLASSSDPLTFGFDASAGPDTGDLFVELLVPSNVTKPVSISVTGTVAGTATLFSTTAWSSGQLDAYLGISAMPTNPIGSYAGASDPSDPTATGFFVYQVDLGTATVAKLPATTGDLETVTLPTGSFVLAFLNEGAAKGWDATANSESILEDGTPTTTTVTPEPSSLLLLGTGAIAVASVLRRRLVPGNRN